jgi:DNA-binding GntR family transcriptional regulator
MSTTSACSSSRISSSEREIEPSAENYRQIYDRFRGAIASGVLKPGDRIPRRAR